MTVSADRGIYLGAVAGPARRSVDDLRAAVASGLPRMLWRRVHAGAEAALGSEPLLPGTAIPGRAAEQVAHANADAVICQAVARRLLRDVVVYLLTDDQRFRDDAFVQLEAIFDRSRWPQWLDFAHERYRADLRTGQLGTAVALTYDWLYDSASSAERAMIVEGLDRCAIQPYLATLPSKPHWLESRNNWQTVVVGGLGIVGMALGSAHDQSERLLQIAQPRMEDYLTIIGPRGEFNESVGYAQAMHYAVAYFAAQQSWSGGADGRLAQHPFPQACRWLLHMTVPPGQLIGYGDSHLRAPLRIGYFGPVASAAGDGVLQWFLQQAVELAEGRGEHAGDDDPNRIDVLDLLWYDPSLAPTPPGTAAPSRDLPLAAAFPAWGGLVSSRCSWTDPDAVVVCGKAGRERNHEHLDDGQLTVDAYQASLIVDLGSPSSYPADFFGDTRYRYYNASVAGHNVLQLGGREMRLGKPRQGTFLHTSFAAAGAAWSIDLTGAYEGAQLVRRSVIHLLPGLVVVLDECALDRSEEVLLRWHTADRAEIDGEGSFTVVADGPTGGVQLLGQVCAVGGQPPLRYYRAEHEYQPPHHMSRLDEPLVQRRESYVAAAATAHRCRLLTLLLVAGTEPPRWPPERTGTGQWSVPVAGDMAELSVTETALQAGVGGRQLSVPLQPLA